MSAHVIRRVDHLAGTLADLKGRVRTALATELAGAAGAAVRDVLIAVLIDRLVSTPRPSAAYARGRRGDRSDRDRDGWDDPREAWDDPGEYDDPPPVRYATEQPTAAPAVPAAAVAVGVNVGRWWLARGGTVGGSVGFGVVAAALGLGGGPLARVALSVLAAAADLLVAEAALGRAAAS
jgi:hypothetical protein